MFRKIDRQMYGEPSDLGKPTFLYMIVAIILCWIMEVCERLRALYNSIRLGGKKV